MQRRTFVVVMRYQYRQQSICGRICVGWVLLDGLFVAVDEKCTPACATHTSYRALTSFGNDFFRLVDNLCG